MKKAVAYTLAAVSLGVIPISCADQPGQTSESTAKLQERWDWQNDPANMDSNHWGRDQYNMVFQELPTKKFLSVQPWSDDYWPTYRGGITYRWNGQGSDLQRYAYDLLGFDKLNQVDLRSLSPAEKFDIYMGWEDFYFTKYERSRTNIMRTVPGSREYDRNFEIPKWEGLCHAWAPATLLYEEPKPVTLKGPSGIEVPFGSSDIKALLIAFLHYSNSETRFLGQRCNFDLNELEKKYHNNEISKEDYQKYRKSCDDSNAGAFHVVLANQVGLLGEGFIADVTRESEVWNQAVYGYETKVLRSRSGASEGAAPGTVREVDVKTKMYYTTEISQSYAKPAYQPTVYKSYAYTIELDGSGRIIGGAWSSHERPDFLWKQTRPKATGIWKHVMEIYNKSVSTRQSD